MSRAAPTPAAKPRASHTISLATCRRSIHLSPRGSGPGFPVRIPRHKVGMVVLRVGPRDAYSVHGSVTRVTASFDHGKGATRKAVGLCGRTRINFASPSVKDKILYSRPPSTFLR